ncbi:hypothetical protein PILCRDRAFT_814823 [Piloderma croceum F 1598]|uniref:Helicase C-terminal domain-containing protein n=1 Tax=Piloderma croceum (strain F 1598) TaxID=765440 RepID=A0A0C3G6A5_PILCF|nr:hypothetical protein PILCRDRAFT_814823 [Piloderma croceum F 1598]
MQRFALSVCSQCRLSLSRPGHPEKWFSESQYISRRFRSGKTSPVRFQKRPHKGFGEAFSGGGYVNTPPRPSRKLPKGKEEHIRLGELPKYLALRVPDWMRMPTVQRRLEQFGVPKQDIPTLLIAFRDDVSDGLLTRPGIEEKYTLDRFAGAFTGTHNGRTDEVLTNIFYSWASDPDHQSFLETIVPPSTLDAIIQLHALADHSYPANAYSQARSIQRKFVMHVGPTNSGKTHMALRALAAARTGAYAGPLRLLAHEVWERLNKGQIVPLGVDPDADAEPDTDTGIDTMGVDNSERPTLRKQGNPKYAKECNLVTGEEMKIVSENAGLVSCTVEMLTPTRLYDVAVVDEIQMIADSNRGGAWTRAVLGLFAKEIHLCGEETAIPIVQALVKETGDELVINRYTRLTPLILQEQTLEGDFGRVQKGDCIVTFTRSGIFALKRQVEEQTGMRCAVAYGRLPPEVRSEQAALFNDPDSGYDVMIASDAIGMGLNLKIKRIVFEATHKFNGIYEAQLSDSQIKQIAGRAGRFGMRGHDEPNGFVATLHQNDLPIVRKALGAPIKPLSCAYINPSNEIGGRVVDCLPFSSSSLVLLETYKYVSRTRWPFQFEVTSATRELCDFIDTTVRGLTLEDKLQLMMAPVAWRDSSSLDIVARFYRQYCNQMQVNLVQCLRDGEELDCLEGVEMYMKHGLPRSSPAALSRLEVLHKALVLYMWMHMRSPVSWSDHVEANNLKERTERALEWCLKGLSWGKVSHRLPDPTTLGQTKADGGIAYINQREALKHREMKRDRYMTTARERAASF